MANLHSKCSLRLSCYFHPPPLEIQPKIVMLLPSPSKCSQRLPCYLHPPSKCSQRLPCYFHPPSKCSQRLPCYLHPLSQCSEDAPLFQTSGLVACDQNISPLTVFLLVPSASLSFLIYKRDFPFYLFSSPFPLLNIFFTFHKNTRREKDRRIFNLFFSTSRYFSPFQLA